MKQTEYLRYYDRSAKRISATYEETDISFLMQILTDHFRGVKRVLEIGTGSGRDASFLLQKGFDVTGIDGSEAMVHEAERWHPELSGKIIQAVLPDEWPVFDKPFEAMFSIATLMHFSLEELDILLSRCRNDLLPGAPVLISVSGKRDKNRDSRDLLDIPAEEWLAIFRRNGYDHISTKENKDAAGRDIVWYTFLLKTMQA